MLPVYFNEGEVGRTVDRIRNVLSGAGLNFEIVLVDDGSCDRSIDELEACFRENPTSTQIIKLTRNFGQVAAIMAGFEAARGECVAFMSADGQDPVELLPKMFAEWHSGKGEIVIAARRGREDGRYRRITSAIFYRLMRRLSYPTMPIGGFDFALLGPKAKNALLANSEAHMFLQGQILWTGFSVSQLEYVRRERLSGNASRWTLERKLSYFYDGLLSNSYFPLRLISYSGFLVALSGFLYAIVILLQKVFFGHPVEGWTPLMITVLSVGGIQMIMLGVIGEYLWRVLAQVRNRSTYVIQSHKVVNLPR